SEDWELWLRLSRRSRFAHVPAVTTLYRVSGENTMANPATMERSMGNVARSLEGQLGARELARLRATVALGNAVNYGGAGQRAAAWRWLAAVLRHDAPRALDWRYLRTALRLLVPRPLLTLLGSLRRG